MLKLFYKSSRGFFLNKLLTILFKIALKYGKLDYKVEQF